MMRLKDYELEVSTLRDLLRKQSSLGDKACIILDGRTVTFAELNARANRVGNALRAHGVGKGDVVATYMHNSLDHVFLWLGCAKIGAIWAPLNIALKELDLAHTLEVCSPKTVAMDSELVDNYAAIRDAVAKPGMIEILRSEEPHGDFMPFDALYDAADEEPEASVHWSDPAGIIFTGGSTGLPKGVVVSNAWYFGGAYRYLEMFRPTGEDVHIGVGQLYHAIGSAVDIVAPLHWGITSVLTRWFTPAEFWQSVRRYKGTLAVLVGPLVLALHTKSDGEASAGNSLRLVATATAGIPPEILADFRARFGVDSLEIYGQTETGPLGIINQRLHDRPYHSQGTPNGWADMMIGDQYGSACPPDIVGEILVRPRYPAMFMCGYFNRPEKYAEACRDLWFHTGDLGSIDGNGYLHFVGRMAHSIRRRGENIAAVEVEQAIMTHPKIVRCAVIGVKSTDTGDEDVMAFVQLAESAELGPLDVVKYCESKIAYFKVPRFVKFVSEFPVSASKGEIERHRLKEHGTADAYDREAAGYKVRRPTAPNPAE